MINKIKKAQDKVQGLNVFWRKVILFTAITALAAPFLFLIGKRFTNRAANFNSNMIMKQFEVDENVANSFLEIKKVTQELQDQLSATTTTSTDFTD